MGFRVEARGSDSPYLDKVTRGWSEGNSSVLRPAESHWHMVLVTAQGKTRFIVTGALPNAGIVSCTADTEVLWIKLKLGVFLPHLPAKALVDKELELPNATGKSFWLGGATWQTPTFDNVESFLGQLAHAEALVCDPLVRAVLQNHPHDMAPRTIRHRFIQATGLSRTHIHQIERAHQAAALLRQGMSILDTAHQVGYFDQPHLTRALKQRIGYTPAQLVRERA